MPTPYNAALRALRMKYKVAFTAHESCMQALTEARLSGASPTPDLLQREEQALRAVNEARDRLIAAMLDAPGE